MAVYLKEDIPKGGVACRTMQISSAPERVDLE